jgi:protocatechuate 3,4-dioxygenase beta subunit
VFEFTGLPAGSYRVSANPGQWYAQYLNSAYGARRPPRDPGQSITVADNQAFDRVTISLPRGAVIAGRVTDENGQPIARVQVYGMWFPAGSPRGVRNGGGAQTDDLGQFRLFGLQPGEYLVVAETRANTFVPPNASADEGEATGLVTSYYPGVADEGSAQRVRAVAGGETQGLEIRMQQGRMYRLSGTVVDSQGRPVARANGSLMQRGPGSEMSFGASFFTDEQGRFQMRNIAAAEYRVVIRPRIDTVDGRPRTSGEGAQVPLTVAGDIEGLIISTSPMVTIKGRIEFDPAPPPQVSPRQIRVFATPADNDRMPMPQPSGSVEDDLTFTMSGMMGEYLLRASLPDLFLKSVTVGGQDVTDTPREFKPQDRVTIVLTSRGSTLDVSVTDNDGKPADGATVMVFSEDKSSWRVNSVRVRRGISDATGHAPIRGLLPGRYYAVASSPERLAVFGQVAPSFFEELVKNATSVVIGEDEVRTIDLRMTEPGS